MSMSVYDKCAVALNFVTFSSQFLAVFDLPFSIFGASSASDSDKINNKVEPKISNFKSNLNLAFDDGNV